MFNNEASELALMGSTRTMDVDLSMTKDTFMDGINNPVEESTNTKVNPIDEDPNTNGIDLIEDQSGSI